MYSRAIHEYFSTVAELLERLQELKDNGRDAKPVVNHRGLWCGFQTWVKPSEQAAFGGGPYFTFVKMRESGSNDYDPEKLEGYRELIVPTIP